MVWRILLTQLRCFPVLLLICTLHPLEIVGREHHVRGWSWQKGSSLSWPSRRRRRRSRWVWHPRTRSRWSLVWWRKRGWTLWLKLILLFWRKERNGPRLRLHISGWSRRWNTILTQPTTTTTTTRRQEWNRITRLLLEWEWASRWRWILILLLLMLRCIRDSCQRKCITWCWNIGRGRGWKLLAVVFLQFTEWNRDNETFHNVLGN